MSDAEAAAPRPRGGFGRKLLRLLGHVLLALALFVVLNVVFGPMIAPGYFAYLLPEIDGQRIPMLVLFPTAGLFIVLFGLFGAATNPIGFTILAAGTLVLAVHFFWLGLRWLFVSLTVFLLYLQIAGSLVVSWMLY